GGGGDHSGFDSYLAEINRLTNPRQLLGRLLSGKRILWVDPKLASNIFGMEFLEDAAAAAGGATSIDQVPSVDEALGRLADLGADLVVTHWGQGLGSDGSSIAEELLRQMRARSLEAPLVVFASGA